MWYTSSMGLVEIQMTKAQAHKGYHSGDCEADVRALMKEPNIARQLKKLDPEKVKIELKEFGAWTRKELENHEDNLMRILWEACASIVDSKKG